MAAAPATAEALPAQALGRDKEVDGLEARRKNVPPRDISTRESAESNNSAATNTARKTKSRGLDPVSTPNKAPPDSFRSCPRSPSPLSMGATGRKPPRKERSVEESIIRASSPFGLQPVTSVAQLKLSLPSGFMGVGGRELTPVPVSGSAEYSVLLAQLEKHRSDLSSVSKSYTAKYAELEKLKTLYEMEQMEHLGPKAFKRRPLSSGSSRSSERGSSLPDPLPDVDPLIEQLVKKENDLEDALVKAELQIINNKTLLLLEKRAYKFKMSTKHDVQVLDEELKHLTSESGSALGGLYSMEVSTKEKMRRIDGQLNNAASAKQEQDKARKWVRGILQTMKQGEGRVAIQTENQKKIMAEILNRERDKQRKEDVRRQAERAVVAMETMVKRRQAADLMEAARRIREHTGLDPMQMYDRMCGPDSQSMVLQEMQNKSEEARRNVADMTKLLKKKQEEVQKLQLLGSSTSATYQDIDNAKEKLQGAGMRFQVADANLQSIHDLLFPLAMGIVSITESLDVFRELGANYAVPTNLEGISVEEALSKEGAADVIVSRIKHSIEKLGTIMACQSKWDPKYVPPKRVETPKKVEKAKTKGKKKGKSPQPSPPPTPPAKEEPKEIDKGILFEPQNRLMQLSMQNSLTGGSNLSKFNIRIDLGAEDDGNYSDDDDADSISGERRSY
ncbi:hypothetical protein CYMTET_44426 [Cymbomonas tetramitiformis]|uniref:Uncharacterized protein n=1 Tax=Cymbomonas tetramitiformis TaxID=36881 RepID=A0AAE0C0A7_9CHLO|nr:hypothetical protein CYMTET_44426 [Cymbomonas tetramitiformis]